MSDAKAQLPWPFAGANASERPKEQFLDKVRSGDLSSVRATLDKHPEWAKIRFQGHTALHWAVTYCHVDVARVLLEKGADPNLRSTDDNRSPIDNASTAEMVNLLLDAGASPDGESPRKSPLHHAAAGGYLGAANALRAAGAKVDFEVAVQLNDIELVRRMLEAKPWLAKPPQQPLLFPSSRGNLELVNLLLEHGADPDSTYSRGMVSGNRPRPLSNAIQGNHFEVARALLEGGASTRLAKGHNNLFVDVVARRKPRYVQLLIQHGANVEFGKGWGDVSLLHVAAGLKVSNRLQVATLNKIPQGQATEALTKTRLLLNGGARVNRVTTDNASPLLFAAIADNHDVCKLLLERGATVDIATACLLGRNADVERWLTQQDKFDASHFEICLLQDRR